MKKLLLTATFIAVSSMASAETLPKTWDVYGTEVIQKPRTVTGCHYVDVPVYETYRRDGSAGEAITGGVIGGVIGNQFGNGSGKDAMTILGVILGAQAADNKERTRISGYTQEKRCTEDVVYENQTVKTYKYSVIEFLDSDGNRQRIEYQK